MNNEQLTSAAQTVVELGKYLDDLKAQAREIYDPVLVTARGYITPSEEIHLRHLQLSYWKVRNALFELVDEIWQDTEQIERATPQQFLVALAAAAILVDAARFLRDSFHRTTVVRRKLDEPDPVYGIPPRMYDNVQKSLTSPYHAWRLWQATRYYDQHREQLLSFAAADGLEPLVATIDRLRDRLRPSLWTYVRTRARVRAGVSSATSVATSSAAPLYGMQEVVGRGLAEVHVRPGHAPSLPKEIRAEVVRLLRPGDVLVVRKEFAATNYFLPGYWPHAALYLGTAGELAHTAVARHPHVEPRLAKLSSARRIPTYYRPIRKTLGTTARNIPAFSKL